jgi:2,4-dienoyl-CoA reductase-like NADH-dependent reductase (Old Yellow Enzyme family)
LREEEVEGIVADFARAARRVREAGFDGVQLHAAHGYLIHQFLHPALNARKDRFGLDARTGIGTAFLDRVIDEVRKMCGADFPVLGKVSWGDECRPAFTQEHFKSLICFLDSKGLAGLEISYGTMEYALNIFRGESVPVEAVLDCNPVLATRNPALRFLVGRCVVPVVSRKFITFAPMYNLEAARLARGLTGTPIISVGGYRSGAHIREAIEDWGIDFVGLSRAVNCEPNFARKLREDPGYESRCTNCNECAVRCDSGRPTRCYGRRPLANGEVRSSNCLKFQRDRGDAAIVR